MGHSSIMGADVAPGHPSGRGADLLGPSDNSDSGSDAVGTAEAHADSDAAGTGERSSVSPRDIREGSDILPDHVVRMAQDEGEDEEDPDAILDENELADLGVDAEPGDDEVEARS
ncbi:MAG: hypothetical protein ABIR26_04670 [Ramlibacter sp.]